MTIHKDLNYIQPNGVASALHVMNLADDVFLSAMEFLNLNEVLRMAVCNRNLLDFVKGNVQQFLPHTFNEMNGSASLLPWSMSLPYQEFRLKSKIPSLANGDYHLQHKHEWDESSGRSLTRINGFPRVNLAHCRALFSNVQHLDLSAMLKPFPAYSGFHLCLGDLWLYFQAAVKTLNMSGLTLPATIGWHLDQLLGKLNVVQLNLSQAKLDADQMEYYFKTFPSCYPHLEVLVLDEVNLHWHQLKTLLSSCPNLKCLSIRQCGIFSFDIEDLQCRFTLQYLNFSNNMIPSNDVAHLKTFYPRINVVF